MDGNVAQFVAVLRNRPEKMKEASSTLEGRVNVSTGLGAGPSSALEGCV